VKSTSVPVIVQLMSNDQGRFIRVFLLLPYTISGYVIQHETFCMISLYREINIILD
jgi:hypothetical protein